MSRQIIDTGSISIEQIEFFEQLKSNDAENADGTQFIFVLTIFLKRI